jgi:hypothetical protein
MGLIRQGDVYMLPEALAQKLGIEDRNRITNQAKDAQGRDIMAYGEATGHYHAVEGANLLMESGGLIVDVPEGGATLKHLGYDGHREHYDIPLAPGRYIPIQQHEWDIVAGWRQVVD